MVLTNKVQLPSEEELSTKEVNVSMSTLMSAAPYIGSACEIVNNEFMLCRFENGDDPRPCIKVGMCVTSCTMKLLRGIKCNCLDTFNQYANCIQKSSGDFQHRYCRTTQAAFDKCMEEKMKMKRPDFGYFSRGRIHTTCRDFPGSCHYEFEDPTPSLPDDIKRSRARFGNRQYWQSE